MSNPMSSAEAAATHSLTTLITSTTSSGPSRKIYPTDDQITSLLHARSRAEHPYVQVGSSGRDYVVMNPLRTLGCLNEESRARYSSNIENEGIEDKLQPSVYDLAGKVWYLMTRRKESQAVIYHGLSGSGKSTTSTHLTTQILSLASPTKTQKRISDQITYLHTLLSSFGASKTPLNPSASQHGLYSELHFTQDGRITGAKALAFGLNKSRVGGKLRHDERSFHIFYQLLAGASPEERDSLGLEDPSAYAMLAQSGCYRLPGGPFSDDSTQLSELRVALASLGFKAKHVRSIFTVLIAILTLSNLEFTDDRGHGSLGMTSLDERARVLDRHVLGTAAAHLGVSADDLEAVLVNRTRWVRKDLCSMFLDTRGAEQQRDTLMRDVYAILFTFVVEMANKKLGALSEDTRPELQIVQLDLPGHTSRTMTDAGTSSRPGSMFQPLINATGENGFDEFSSNFVNELLHSYLLQRAFDDSSAENLGMAEDGMRLPGVITMDNSSAIDLLRGGPLNQKRLAREPGGIIGLISSISEEFKGDDESLQEQGEKVLSRFTRQFGRHPSYIVSPGLGSGPLPDRNIFAINHYSSACSYDVADFAELNLDVLDKQLVDLLRGSSDGFVAKLVSGPGLAVEGHPLDPNITVEAQVSSTPLRLPTSVVNPRIGSNVREGDAQWPLDVTVPQPVAAQLNGTISTLVHHLDQFKLWTVYCLRPSDTGHANAFDKRRVKAQVRSLGLPDLVNRRQVDWVADYGLNEFCLRHELRVDGPGAEEDAVEDYARSMGWTRGKEFELGRERVWFGWNAWKIQEDQIRSGETMRGSAETLADDEEVETEEKEGLLGGVRGGNSERDLLRGGDGYSPASAMVSLPYGSGPVLGHSLGGGGYNDNPDFNNSAIWSDVGGGAGNGKYEPDSRSPYAKVRSEENLNYHHQPSPTYPSSRDIVGDKEESGGIRQSRSPVEFNVHEKSGGNKKKHHTATEVIATTKSRRWWIRITWACTFWIPSFLLSSIGKMKRPDVRMAWREKVTIFMMVLFACGTVLFYIIGFGKLLCPNGDKAWNTSDLAGHAGTTDYYAAIAGNVYDFTNFYKGQHSDITAYPTSPEIMLQFAGQDLTNYFPPPMTLACPGLVTNNQLELRRANFTAILDYAIHRSGNLQTEKNTRLNDGNWYNNRLLPDLKQYYKGAFVYSRNYVQNQADGSARQWAIYKDKVYDLSDYLYTVTYYATSSGPDFPNYKFLDSSLSALFSTNAGQDITKQIDSVIAGMTDEKAQQTWNCLDTAFYVGQTDFRESAKCLVQNYLLLALSVVLCTVILVKFLAALQLGAKRHPEIFDKFVICQVPCYTEGEESLKRTIDSLAILNYDDKRKLIFIICDGNIIGSGNNRPTPRIVLDILGVDPTLDPEPLLFKSIGEGSKQLNYGRIYSGLYEHEGHVVPYIVVVKVGKPTETSKPGNRGKRDSQVLLLQYLNRVHFEAPMSPLELEIYHQMRNVIGIDPAFYEYIFQVDADTTVEPDSLNRLIACTSDDSQIIGICGETKLENERESLTTMIQVYEYFISHHLTKAFESLFGSVTCLPGCFSVYRIRTADKGRPIIISSVVIDEYAEPNVDTLHKKNLFSLGEDRYLTTLMMKHFPTYKMKFTPDAIARTVAPSRWNVLLSQRRRWINSTVHNLVELIALPELCGFCFFSLRFVVFIDLLGTIILPATCVYLVYLIVIVSIGKAAIPVISLAMIGAVYGLQMIIFILKREFMLIGWMFLYILAFPVYSVYLPIYSFWSMDDFSWGNTRQVVGEGNQKTVLYDDDEIFTDDMIPYKSFKDYEAGAWETQSVHSEKSRQTELSNVRSQAPSFRPPRFVHSRNVSQHSSTASLPQGGDYWRDSSPLGPSHSSRNLRGMPSQSTLRSNLNAPQPPFMNGQRVQSMAGLSMWGGGSVYDSPQPPGFMNPQMTGMSGGSPMMNPMGMGIHPQAQMSTNPFDSPITLPVDASGGRQSGFYPSYPAVPGMMGMGAPRGSVMTNLGGYGMMNQGQGAQGGGGMPRGVSTYSLATTTANHPLAPPLQVNSAKEVDDDEVVGVLRRYLATQDLMSVTKRQTREAIYGLFPNAGLQTRAPWVNENIDKILSE